ncbi:hypothetical protein VSH64_09505 [Amycolatopsis rhabdoformis]|uniref:Uncharacterized protein n=1 Tax=Amycolatopsis rhabdoformis TaxID=1448059 RepID=A0ABZ1ID53_9PSEU|nr:hypothetical protein [Amycolatopsis rhabdoformis]WSE32337.1 hypothetical protein VSH64_09505 [Amycolatopsis rhabdoformis]
MAKGPQHPEPDPTQDSHGEGEPPDGVEDAQDTGQQVIGELRERGRE